MATRRPVPILAPEQIALHGRISDPQNVRLFSLDAAVALLRRFPRKTPMTAPHQRTRALLKTRYFLEELTRPGDTPRVPAQIRETARRLLRDYPGFDEIELAHKALPDVFGPVVQRQSLGLSYREFNK